MSKRTIPEHWITHLGGSNREPIGWITPRDDGFVAIDLLGRERTGVVSWLEAEETLDELGIRYLADPYNLATETGAVKVYIAEATPGFVRVKEDDFQNIDATQTVHTHTFTGPAPLQRP